MTGDNGHDTGMHKVGVYYPLQPQDPRQLAPFARLVASGLADRLWIGESLTLETHQVLAYVLGQGVSPPLGLGLSLMPLRHPYEAAVAVRSLANLSGKPLAAAFGPGSSEFVAAMLGEPYANPLGAARGYVSTVSRLLRSGSGQPPDGHVAEGIQLAPMRSGPEIEVGLGVLRPGMARTASAVADLALTWMTPPQYLRATLRPALRRADNGGPTEATRAPVRLVSVVHFVVERPGRDIAAIICGATEGHLTQKHYRAMLRAAGLDLERASQAGQHAVARELVDHGVVLVGGAESIASAIRGYWEAGADEVVLNPCGVLLRNGEKEALRDILEVTEACRAQGRPASGVAQLDSQSGFRLGGSSGQAL